MKWILLSLLFMRSLIFPEAFSQSSPYTPYIIKKGDTVSKILGGHSFSPLFGENQWVEKVLKMNRLNEVSARKLEPGDVIVIPVESHLFSKDEFKDEVTLLESSWKKSMIEEYLAPKKHNIEFLTRAFTRDYFIGDDGIRVNQGLAIKGEYKKRDPESHRGFSFNPIVGLAFYSQSNADFSSDENLVAEFTPSSIVTAKLELENREFSFSISPVIESESFSTLVGTSAGYDVERLNIVWAGVDFNKYFYRKNHTYQINLSAQEGVSTDRPAQKTSGFVRTYFRQHYVLELFAEQSFFNTEGKTTRLDSGISLGYRF